MHENIRVIHTIHRVIHIETSPFHTPRGRFPQLGYRQFINVPKCIERFLGKRKTPVFRRFFEFVKNSIFVDMQPIKVYISQFAKVL